MSKEIKLVQRLEYVKQACEGKKVLHLGCTDYPYTELAIKNSRLLHFELEEIADELYGFDFDAAGIEILEKYGTKKLFQADLENLAAVDLDEKFDVIIAGEMIEHLSNPGLFLNGIKRFMHAETDLIITTVNAYSGLRFAIYALRGKGGINEPVHPDHVAYYSYRTLSLIIERANFKIREFCFYDLGTPFRKEIPFHYRLANDLPVKISKQLADGVIAVCRLP